MKNKNLIQKILSSEASTYISMGMISLPIVWSAYVHQTTYTPSEPIPPREISYLESTLYLQKELQHLPPKHLTTDLTSKLTALKEEVKKSESTLSNNLKVKSYFKDLNEFKIKTKEYWTLGLVYPLSVSFLGFGLLLYNTKKRENLFQVSKN